MAALRVRLWGSLGRAADGAQEVEVEAANVREMLSALTARHPGLAPQVARGVSVAIDGVIYREAWLQPLRPENEIVLMPYMTGG